MARVEMYSSDWCGYCAAARRLLGSKGVEVEVYTVDGDADLRRKMTERAGGRHTVPQIFIDDRHVGGFDDLAALEAGGDLDPLLGEAAGPA